MNTPYSRRSFLQHTGMAAVAAARATRATGQETTRPANVVLVMSDEHNPKVTSLEGHLMVQTPNMSRLAAEGTTFGATYCPSPLCMPCRSSFMSGRRVHEIQCYSNCNVFPFDYPSYGQVLRDQGVHTVHIGKVDAYRPAHELGFSEVFNPGDRARPGDTHNGRTPLMIRKGAAERADGYGPRDANPFGGDDRSTNTALKWLRETAPTLNGPWVLVVQLVKPHFPHYVPRERWDLYPNGDDLPEYRGDVASAQHPYAKDLRAHFETDQFTEDQIRGLRRGYLGCVTYVDQQLGRIMDAVDAGDFAENTLFAYASDHGDMLGKFNMWWKCSLYEDSARVPLIVRGPGFAKGVRNSTPVDLLDLQASFFRATRADRPSDWTGTPLQDAPLNSSDQFAFSEYHGHGTRSGGYLIRRGHWKLMYNMKAPHQLFNLAEDPEELDNLAEKHAGKVKEFEDLLRSVCSPEEENARAHAFEERQLAATGAKA